VVVVRDLDASLRFYWDGIGLDLLQDRHVEGDWPDLFDAPSRRVRAVFLGNAAVPDDHAGVLELNVFDGDIPRGPPPAVLHDKSSRCTAVISSGHASHRARCPAGRHHRARQGHRPAGDSRAAGRGPILDR
jgi:hypothetical protein